MASVVRELQSDCLDSKVRVSDLLRKALVVARKLGLKEFDTWVSHELNGYPQESEVPKYRELSGQVRAWNPERGWIPVRFENPKDARLFSSRETKQSIGSLEALLENSKGVLGIPFPPEIENQVLTTPFLSNLSLQASPAALHGILDAVRNAVLNWTLKLEEDGVLGEGLSFSEEERQAVSFRNWLPVFVQRFPSFRSTTPTHAASWRPRSRLSTRRHGHRSPSFRSSESR